MDNQKKVLLVEDDALLSIVGEKLITKLGYTVADKATSGEEAIRKIDECNPDILIMDIQLAGTLDGIDTVKKLRDRHNNIPVIFLSGSNDSLLQKQAKAVNCIEYLVKPINADALLQPLKKAAIESNKQTFHAA